MNQEQPLLLIFDGDCGFCTLTAGWAARLGGPRIEARPWQFIPQRLAAAGLTPADGMTQAWAVDAAGRLYGGAAAVNKALAQNRWLRPLTWLYRLPGLRQLEDKLYRWTANNRYRLPGGTPACQMEQLS